MFLRPPLVLLRSKRYEFFLLWFIFHPKGSLVMFSSLRGCLAACSALCGCLGWTLGLLGMLPCFDPTHCPEFGTGFWLGNRGNLDLCSS